MLSIHARVHVNTLSRFAFVSSCMYPLPVRENGCHTPAFSVRRGMFSLVDMINTHEIWLAAWC